MKLTLTYIKRYEKVSARTNKPFTSVSIKAKEYGDKYISGFGNANNASWKEGDEVEVLSVTPKGEYLNFEMPKTSPRAQDPALMGKIILNLGNIERKLDQVIKHLSNEQRLDLTSDGTKVPDFTEVDELNNPF